MNKLVGGSSSEASKPGLGRIPDDNVSLVIPCSVSKFGEFLSGLLSKPQTLKGEVEGIFDIGHKEIANVYHLIDQRINSQNQATLAHFEIKVVYDNGTSVTHKKVGDFESYYPTVAGTPSEVVLSFNYLIKFTEREVPEKQSIVISFIADPNRNNKREKWYAGGLISWQIENTERTWAADINGLLKNHAHSCVSKTSGLWHWIRKYYEEVAHYFGILIIAVVMLFWLFSTLDYLDATMAASQIARYFSVSFVAFSMLYLVIGTIVRIVTLNLIVKKESFISLVEKDIENKKSIQEKSKRRLWLYALSFLFNILAGIAANLLYNSDWARSL